MKNSLSVELVMAVWRAVGSGGLGKAGSGWKVGEELGASWRGAAGRSGWEGVEGVG